MLEGGLVLVLGRRVKCGEEKIVKKKKWVRGGYIGSLIFLRIGGLMQKKVKDEGVKTGGRCGLG